MAILASARLSWTLVIISVAESIFKLGSEIEETSLVEKTVVKVVNLEPFVSENVQFWQRNVTLKVLAVISGSPIAVRTCSDAALFTLLLSLPMCNLRVRHWIHLQR